MPSAILVKKKDIRILVRNNPQIINRLEYVLGVVKIKNAGGIKSSSSSASYLH